MSISSVVIESPRPWQPVTAILLAATLWGLVWYPLRLLEEAGLAGLWASAAAYGCALLVGGFLYRQHWSGFQVDPKGLMLIGLAMGWCNVGFVLAVLEGSILRVLLLFYLSPLWTILLARWVLKEPITRRHLWVLVIAMSGAFTMLWDPTDGLRPEGPADWLAISSGLAFALGNTITRRTQSVSVQSKSLATWIGVLLIACAGLLLIDGGPPDVAAATWGGAALLGLFGFFLMTLFSQYGVTHMPVRRSAILMLFELVVGAVSAALLAAEWPQLRDWIGGALIIVAAILAITEKEHER